MERTEEPAIIYDRLFLDALEAQVLKYSPEEHDRLNDMKKEGPILIPRSGGEHEWEAIRPWEIVSFYEYDPKTVYHIHPELVQTCKDGPQKGRRFVRVCPRCMGHIENKKVPLYSIAAGVDFGNAQRLGLEPLSLHEQLIVSRCRIYMATIKLLSNCVGHVTLNQRQRLQGHAVLFRHDAPAVANASVCDLHDVVNPRRLESLLQIYFVDEKGRSDSLIRKMVGSSQVLARPWVLFQRLAVLKVVHKDYHHLHLADYADFTGKVDKANDAIARSVIRINDKDSVEFEMRLGSDIASAQSREVRHEDVNDQTAGKVAAPAAYSVNYERL